MGVLCPDVKTVTKEWLQILSVKRRKKQLKMVTHLGEVCVGLKQSKKAVSNGEAKKIYLAHDADRNIKELFEKLCKKKKIEIDMQYSLVELGELCEIDVGAAVVTVLE